MFSFACVDFHLNFFCVSRPDPKRLERKNLTTDFEDPDACRGTQIDTDERENVCENYVLISLASHKKREKKKKGNATLQNRA